MHVLGVPSMNSKTARPFLCSRNISRSSGSAPQGIILRSWENKYLWLCFLCVRCNNRLSTWPVPHTCPATHLRHSGSWKRLFCLTKVFLVLWKFFCLGQIVKNAKGEKSKTSPNTKDLAKIITFNCGRKQSATI